MATIFIYISIFITILLLFFTIFRLYWFREVIKFCNWRSWSVWSNSCLFYYFEYTRVVRFNFTDFLWELKEREREIRAPLTLQSRLKVKITIRRIYSFMIQLFYFFCFLRVLLNGVPSLFFFREYDERSTGDREEVVWRRCKHGKVAGMSRLYLVFILIYQLAGKGTTKGKKDLEDNLNKSCHTECK